MKKNSHQTSKPSSKVTRHEGKFQNDFPNSQQNHNFLCYWYPKEPSHRDGSFRYQQHLFQSSDKEKINYLPSKFWLNWTDGLGLNHLLKVYQGVLKRLF